MERKLSALAELATQVLGDPAPSAARAHELASETLSAIALVQRAVLSSGESHPYRGVLAPPAEKTLVELERALEATEERLRAATAEIARLRGSKG
jgi:transposase-like protein